MGLENQKDKVAPYAMAEDHNVERHVHSPEEESLSSIMLEKYWTITGIAALALSLLSANEIQSFLMFFAYLAGYFIGLLAGPALAASIIALVFGGIITLAGKQKPFKNVFWPIFTGFLYIFWLLAVIGNCIRIFKK